MNQPKTFEEKLEGRNMSLNCCSAIRKGFQTGRNQQYSIRKLKCFTAYGKTTEPGYIRAPDPRMQPSAAQHSPHWELSHSPLVCFVTSLTPHFHPSVPTTNHCYDDSLLHMPACNNHILITHPITPLHLLS